MLFSLREIGAAREKWRWDGLFLDPSEHRDGAVQKPLEQSDMIVATYDAKAGVLFI